jgi:hypothetical protein
MRSLLTATKAIFNLQQGCRLRTQKEMVKGAVELEREQKCVNEWYSGYSLLPYYSM